MFYKAGKCLIILFLFMLDIILANGGDNVMSYLANLIRLIGPLLAFCIMFGLSRNGEGFDFRLIRISIAISLWYFSWYCWKHAFSQYFEAIAHAFLNSYDSKFHFINGFLTATYDAISIMFIMALSYTTGKWISDVFNSSKDRPHLK